jgi:hypothetical protein
VRSSRRLLVSNPSLRNGVLVWIEQNLGVSRVRERRVARGNRTRTRLRIDTPRLFWTTAIAASGVYVTRWNTNNSRAFIQQVAR